MSETRLSQGDLSASDFPADSLSSGDLPAGSLASSDFLTGKNFAPKTLGRVLVLGLGKSGKAAVSYLYDLLGSRVTSLTVYGGKRTDENASWMSSYCDGGAQLIFDCEQVEGQFDLCIASPGISQFGAFYQSAQAHCAEIISEVEFAWRECDSSVKWVTITGTNGKTTTTALTAHLLNNAGYTASAVGNIGDAVLEAVRTGGFDVFVLEASSYQLASTRLFASDVAVLLNITPDHLTWHGSMEEYIAAKRKVLRLRSQVDRQAARSTVVLDATNDIVREIVREIKAIPVSERDFDYIPLGTAAGLRESMVSRCGSENAASLGCEKRGLPSCCAADPTTCSKLVVKFRGQTHKLGKAEDLQIKGEHNASNALAAASAAIALGASSTDVARALFTFAALEHRIEPCGFVNGVECYNDSKGTNVDATLKAFSAFAPGRAIVLLGGRDKMTDLTPLVDAARENAYAVVLFGESKARFMEAFSAVDIAPCKLLEADHMVDALDVALAHATPENVVLLSPACASFDEFSCYEERGEVFKRLVAKRAQVFAQEDAQAAIQTDFTNEDGSAAIQTDCKS